MIISGKTLKVLVSKTKPDRNQSKLSVCNVEINVGLERKKNTQRIDISLHSNIFFFCQSIAFYLDCNMQFVSAKRCQIPL